MSIFTQSDKNWNDFVNIWMAFWLFKMWLVGKKYICYKKIIVKLCLSFQIDQIRILFTIVPFSNLHKKIQPENNKNLAFCCLFSKYTLKGLFLANFYEHENFRNLINCFNWIGLKGSFLYQNIGIFHRSFNYISSGPRYSR